MTTLYHVTKWRRLPSIRKVGLVRGKRPTWRNPMGMNLGSRAAIYLCSTEDSAIALAARLEWGMISKDQKDTRVAILDIEAGGIVTEPDRAMEGVLYGWLLTRQDIPATAINRERMLTPDMTQALVRRLRRTFEILNPVFTKAADSDCGTR